MAKRFPPVSRLVYERATLPDKREAPLEAAPRTNVQIRRASRPRRPACLEDRGSGRRSGRGRARCHRDDRHRVIDNAAVAAASIGRRAVASARSQAIAHPFAPGSTVFGLQPTQRISPEWAAWANGVAVRELDFHDTFLAADYSHPGDNIPPLLAVAQQCGCTGAQLLHGLVVAYEIQMDLVRAICLHAYKKDHIAHLCPSAAA